MLSIKLIIHELENEHHLKKKCEFKKQSPLSESLIPLPLPILSLFSAFEVGERSKQWGSSRLVSLINNLEMN